MPDSIDALLAKRFIERRDVKAVQHPGGAYTPERTPWKMGDLRAHLAGEKTFGHYLISEEGNTKLFAFDIDLVKNGYWISTKEDKLLNGGEPCNPREIWLTEGHEGREYLTAQLRAMAEGLAIRTHRLSGGEFPVAMAYSGNKGLHVYGLIGSTPAEEARAIAIEVLKSFHCFEPARGNNFWVHKTEYKNLEIEIFPKQDELSMAKTWGT